MNLKPPVGPSAVLGEGFRVFDVESDFGAYGDLSNNDTGAFQEAFDTASDAGHGIVALRPGANYRVGTIVPRPGVTVWGYGATFTKDATLSSNGIISNIAAQVPVSDFNVFGPRFIGEGQDYATADRRGAIVMYSATNCRVRDCYGSGFGWAGIEFNGAQRIWIEDNELEDVCTEGNGNGIYVTIGAAAFTPTPLLSNSIVITGNRVKNCRTAPICVQTSYDTTIPATYLSYDLTIANNPFLEAVGGATSGFASIALEVGRIAGIGSTTQGSRIRRVQIHHNTCHYTGPATNAWAIAISDNNGSDPKSTDPDEMADINVDHNLIDSTGGGINCQASRAQIDHNTLAISSTSSFGIYLSGNGDAAHIPANQVVDTNIVKMPADGISGIFATAVRRPVIKGNTVTYATGSTTSTSPGIRATGCFNPKVTGNTVDYAPRAGIYVDLNQNLRCTDNDVFNCNEVGAAVNTGSGIYHIPPNPLTGREVIRGNSCIDDRGVKKMYLGIFLNNSNSGRIHLDGNDSFGGTQGSFGWNVEPAAMGGSNFTDVNSTPAYPAAITVTASPFTWQNLHPYPVTVATVGGTVSSIVKQRTNGSHQITTGQTAGEVYVDAGDYVIVTYTAAPTMAYWPVKA